MLSDVRDKHILDTSAWNALFDDPDRELLIEAALSRSIFPTCIAITEVAATEHTARRIDILRLMKTLGRDNRPIASPNQLIIMACEGYAKRAAMITLNAGSDAEGAWIALSDPTQVDEVAQRLALDFNEERENVMKPSPKDAWGTAINFCGRNAAPPFHRLPHQALLPGRQFPVRSNKSHL